MRAADVCAPPTYPGDIDWSWNIIGIRGKDLQQAFIVTSAK